MTVVLIDVAVALEKKFQQMSLFVGRTVNVLTDEGYAEIVAENDRNNGKVEYPIVVMRSQDYDTDKSRYTNDRVDIDIQGEVQNDGHIKYFQTFDMPYVPVNLNYQIDLIAETRKDIDLMVLWVLKHIKDRDYLDISYKDYLNNDAIYCSLIKRGTIVKADDKDGNVITLRRRTFEIIMTTLIEADNIQSEVLVESVIPNAYLKE